MKILMDLVNRCFEDSSFWQIHALQEKNAQWVDLQINYDSTQKSIRSSNNWDRAELSQIYWEAGLIQSRSDNPLQKWIAQIAPFQKVRALAPDTNLLILRYTSNFLRRYISSSRNAPVLILFARSIQYELHTMVGSKYSMRMNEQIEEVITQSLKDWPHLQIVWRFRNTDAIKPQIAGLSDKRGRIGLRGVFEVESLHKWAPVIVVKPPHILHSPKVLESSQFLNAVHDSLIRYEIDFVGQNTSLPILFLSNDKDQCKSAEQEGLETLHVQRPFIKDNVDSLAARNINLERIRALLLSLLGFSPGVRLSSNQGEYYLAWTWRGRHIDDISDHKIRVVDPKGNIETITP